MMKKNLKNLMLLPMLAGALVITSCKNSEGENEKAPESIQTEMHQGGGQAKIEEYKGEDLQADFKEENIAEIYTLYVDIKDAFVNTNAEAASEKAAKLAEKAGENEEIGAIANAIAEIKDVNKQREEFSKLTAAMEPVLHDALESGEIYKQYCPMAFEGKGDFWFSNSKDIFNPYYGDKMLKCGRVEATIQ